MQIAVVFCLDPGSRLLALRKVEFDSPEDLLRRLEPELDGCAVVEAWAGNVRLVRLGADRPPEWSPEWSNVRPISLRIVVEG